MFWFVTLAHGVLVQGALVYTNARNIGVRGRANFLNAQATTSGRAGYYHRLPGAAEGNVRDSIWWLQKCATGLHVQFKTCSNELSVSVTYSTWHINTWNHPPSGLAGLDLYVWDSSWRWIAITSNYTWPTSTSRLAALQGSGTSRYRMHLPTLNGVTDLYIGHDAACPLEPDYDEQRQIVWYGTSITQGSLASRPGMIFTNSIALRLPYTVLNFGFSSNCLMEIDVAQYLVQIPDPALFVIDCLANMGADDIRSKTFPLVHFLRQYHPYVPIVLAEDSTLGAAWLEVWERLVQIDKRSALRASYMSLVAAGYQNLHYVYREQLFDFTAEIDKLMSPTIDRIHPNDLGMQAITDFYIGYLPQIISGSPLDARNLRRMQLHRDVKVVEWFLDTDLQERNPKGSEGWFWTQIEDFGIMGRAFEDAPTNFNRLPERAKGLVDDLIWNSSLDSTGLFVAFETDATAIGFNYALTSNSSSLWQMPLSGTSGADLYRFNEATGVWGWVSCVSSFPMLGAPHFALFSAILPKLQSPSQYLLFLPLLKEVSWGYVGVNGGASLPRRNAAFAADGITISGRKPIVWCGTSTALVGAATRPGLMYTNSLTRSLGRVVLNMGFAGNGSMEFSELDFLSEIDAEVLVIESSPALTNIGALVKRYRQQRPDASVVLLEKPDFSIPTLRSGKYSTALQCEHGKLVSQGYKDVHFVQSEHSELYNPTVDGVRFTDLGHWEMATNFADYLQQVLVWKIIGSTPSSLSSGNSNSSCRSSSIASTSSIISESV